MKESIYTIPVNEAFSQDCECPMCLLEKRFENETVDYILGPSLMEPDGRAETNENGFCRRHFEILYQRQDTRLGLGLILNTHLQQKNAEFRKQYEAKSKVISQESEKSLLAIFADKLTSKSTETQKYLDSAINALTEFEAKCAVCSKLEHTMDRYMDVVFYLYFKEEEFKVRLKKSKCFCLRHFRDILKGSKKYLEIKRQAEFISDILPLQLENMERIQKEVDWFTKKFDYRNNDASWGNSKDAVPRSIKKIVGNTGNL